MIKKYYNVQCANIQYIYVAGACIYNYYSYIGRNYYSVWYYFGKLTYSWLQILLQIIITKEYLHLEPIGIVLVFFFSTIIVIQFVAMLFHRFGTISHILASTELNCCSQKEELLTDEALIEKNAVEIVKQMQRLRGIDGDQYESESSSSNR